MRQSDIDLIASVFRYADQKILFGKFHPIAAFKTIRNDMSDMLAEVYSRFDRIDFEEKSKLIDHDKD